MKSTVIAVLLLTQIGCVKVQLLPEDSVKNSIKAGKNLYDESKIKRKGGKKREYSSQVVVSEYSSKSEAEVDCIRALKERLVLESVARDAIVASERVFVVDGVSANVIECEVTGFVWPNA